MRFRARARGDSRVGGFVARARGQQSGCTYGGRHFDGDLECGAQRDGNPASFLFGGIGTGGGEVVVVRRRALVSAVAIRILAAGVL